MTDHAHKVEHFRALHIPGKPLVLFNVWDVGSANAVAAAGAKAIATGSWSVAAAQGYADFEDLWWPLPTGVGPAGAFCKSLDDDRRAALHDAHRRRLGVGDGPFELTARAWAVAGTV